MKLLLDQKGFSLIELLVAFALAALLSAAFMGAFATGLRTEGDMNERLEATRIIDSVIEELRNKNLAEKEIESEQDLRDEIEGLSKFQDYNDELSISNITDEDEDDLYSIEISWSDRNYSTETLVSTGVKVTEEDNGDNGEDPPNGEPSNGLYMYVEDPSSFDAIEQNEEQEFTVKIIDVDTGEGVGGVTVNFEIVDANFHHGDDSSTGFDTNEVNTNDDDGEASATLYADHHHDEFDIKISADDREELNDIWFYDIDVTQN